MARYCFLWLCLAIVTVADVTMARMTPGGTHVAGEQEPLHVEAEAPVKSGEEAIVDNVVPVSAASPGVAGVDENKNFIAYGGIGGYHGIGGFNSIGGFPVMGGGIGKFGGIGGVAGVIPLGGIAGGGLGGLGGAGLGGLGGAGAGAGGGVGGAGAGGVGDAGLGAHYLPGTGFFPHP